MFNSHMSGISFSSMIFQIHCSFPILHLFENLFNTCTCNLCNSIVHFCLLSISSFLLDSLHRPASENTPSISPRLYILPYYKPDNVHSAMIPGEMHMSRMPSSWNCFPFEASKFTMVWKVLMTFACMDVCFHAIYVGLHTMLDP